MTSVVGISGFLKWFDVDRGYGFIETETSGQDVLLHANVLRNHGQNSIAPGCRITFTMRENERGFAVVDIASIEPPAESAADDRAPVDVQELEFVPGRVKWYSQGKKFGFVNLFDDEIDYFLRGSILKQGGLSEVNAGEAVAVAVNTDEIGEFVVAIRPWN